MADPEKEQGSKRERRNTSGAASRRSGASRPPSPAPLARYVSGNYIDDQAQYHDHLYHNENENEKENEEALEDGSVDTEDTEEGDGSSESIVPEVRDGIEDQRDVDVEAARLERVKSSKSRRSVRDPNLVTWEGPDDGANPKNWSTSRKWAATLVGELSSLEDCEGEC
jgi:hypothetical protein